MSKRRFLRSKLRSVLGRSSRTRPSHAPEVPVQKVEEEVEMPDVEVDDETLATWLADDEETVLLDIREPMETRGGIVKGALVIPMNSVPSRLEELPAPNTRLLVYCAAGVRSFGVTHWLREQGWSNSWSVTSGFGGVLQSGGELQRD